MGQTCPRDASASRVETLRPQRAGLLGVERFRPRALLLHPDLSLFP